MKRTVTNAMLQCGRESFLDRIKMKTNLEMVDDVVEHILTAGRCVNGNTCIYFREDGNTCAAGFLLKDPAKIEGKYPNYSITSVVSLVGTNIFKDEYRYSHLVTKLQSFHDNPLFFSSAGGKLELTEGGIEKLTRIREEATNMDRAHEIN